MKYLITGSNGLLGNSLKRKLGENNYYHSRKKCDLTDPVSSSVYFSKIGNNNIDTLIHTAALVGGVKANNDNNEKFFDVNYRINNTVVNLAKSHKIKNFIGILSTCVFPDNIPQPITSDQIDNGIPHKTNYGYSYSKRLLNYQIQTIKDVYGWNWKSIIPCNLYGPNDNFNLDTSHVIPALIRKAHLASVNGSKYEIWGSGKPLRQFLYVDDLSDIIEWSINNWKSDSPLMAVNPLEYSIKNVAIIIGDLFDLKPEQYSFDTSKLDGQFRKTASSDVPNWNFTTLENGLEKTVKWYLDNQDKIKI